MKKYSLLLFLFFFMFTCKNFAAKFTLESPAFEMNTMIPAEYTCFGANSSPPLVWHGVPPNTRSLVLSIEDPNPAGGGFTYWLLFNISPHIKKLEAGSSVPDGAAKGINSWGTLAYQGPCPKIEVARYVIKLYALNTLLNLQDGSPGNLVLDAMTGHVIGKAELVGLYQK